MCIQVYREGRHTSVPHTLFLVSIPSLCLFTLCKCSLIIVIFSITYHKRFLLVHHAVCVQPACHYIGTSCSKCYHFYSLHPIMHYAPQYHVVCQITLSLEWMLLFSQAPNPSNFLPQQSVHTASPL